MSRRKPKKIRTIREYVSSARKLAKFAPALAKYAKRKELTRWEKGAITRKEKLIRDAYNLIPVTKSTAKWFKKHNKGLFAPGVRAIEMDNVGAHVKIHTLGDNMFVETNGRVWINWAIPEPTVSELKTAGRAAFQSVENFIPLDDLEKLAKRAFENAAAKRVYLWTNKGRASDGFESIEQFVMWLTQFYQHYRETDKWVYGISFTVGERFERYIPEEWEATDARLKRRKDRQKFTAKMRRQSHKTSKRKRKRKRKRK